MSGAADNPFLSAAFDLASNVMARVNDGAMISYAQNYEDVILRRVFPEPYVGYFVDVGAFDPIKNSVTQHFHLRNWVGANVDPDPDNISRFENLRKNDHNLCMAIGLDDGEKSLFSLPSTSRTTALPELANSYRDRGLQVEERTVPSKCLATLFSDLEVANVDFLKIDVEGSEYDVIAGGDWRQYRPRIVLAEATYPETDEPNWQSWEPILLKSGYQFAYYDGLNRFYVRKEDEDLAQRFESPPNYFDDFVRADTVDLARALMASTQKMRED